MLANVTIKKRRAFLNLGFFNPELKKEINSAIAGIMGNICLAVEGCNGRIVVIKKGIISQPRITSLTESGTFFDLLNMKYIKAIRNKIQ